MALAANTVRSKLKSVLCRRVEAMWETCSGQPHAGSLHNPSGLPGAASSSASASWQEGAPLHGPLRRHSSAAGLQLTTAVDSLIDFYRKSVSSTGGAVTQTTQALHQRQSLAEVAIPRVAPASAAVPSLQELRQADLPALAAAAASVANSNPPDTVYLAAVAAALQHRYDSAVCSPHMTIQLMASFARANYRPKESLLEEVEQALSASLAAASPDDLVILATSMAGLGWRSTRLLTLLAEQVQAHTAQLQPGQLAEVVSACATLSYRESDKMVNAVLQRVLRSMKELSPGALARLVCALAVLRHKDAMTDVLLDAASDEIVRGMSAFTACDLTDMMWSYAALGHWSRIDADLLNAVVARMLKCYTKLEPARMVNLVWAIARVEHSGPGQPRLLRTLAEALVPRLELLSADQVSRLVCSYASLRHYHQELMDKVAEVTLMRLSEYDPGQLGSVLLAYALFLHPPGRLAPLTDRILARVGEVDAHVLANVMWSQAVLRTLTPDIFSCLCDCLARRPLAEFQPQDFERLFHAELMIAADCCPGEVAPTLPEWIRPYARYAWQDKVYLAGNVTPCQQDVCRTLSDIGINFELKESVADGCLAVDIVLRLPGEQQLAIVVYDDPAQFSSNKPYRLLADGMCKQRLLAGQGWRLVPVVKHKWREAGSRTAKAALLMQLLSAAVPQVAHLIAVTENRAAAQAA